MEAILQVSLLPGGSCRPKTGSAGRSLRVFGHESGRDKKISDLEATIPGNILYRFPAQGTAIGSLLAPPRNSLTHHTSLNQAKREIGRV